MIILYFLFQYTLQTNDASIIDSRSSSPQDIAATKIQAAFYDHHVSNIVYKTIKKKFREEIIPYNMTLTILN